MSTLLEIKELIKSIYIKFERIIVPVAKFILAMFILSKLSGFMGQFDTTGKLGILDRTTVRMMMAAIVAFVPATWFVLLSLVTICARLFFVSLEGTIIVFCVLIVLYLMFVRLFPKQAYLVILVPLLMQMNLIYILPIFVGLVIGPAAVVPVGVGVIVYFLSAYLPGLLEIKATDLVNIPNALIEMYRYIMSAATADKGMILMIVVFGAVIVATYFVSQLEFDYIHYIAIGVGGLVNIFGFIIGNIVLNAGVGIGGVFFGSLFAIVVVGAMQFFRFSLDYQKAEKQQFEDDDYYYYVKAVPKIKIARSKKEVKTIE